MKQLIQSRELLVVWTTREIRSRYRQSVLGMGWAIIAPFVQMVVISVVFGRIVGIPSGEVPYPIFLYTALLPWTLFATSVSTSVPAILQNIGLVTKIYFPREILPLSAILSRLVDFLLASVVFMLLMAWYRIPLQTTILFVPILLLIQTIFALGIGLFGGTVSVFVRDISFAIPLLMQIWMYATPIIYPIDMVPPRLLPLYLLNPMAVIIDSYRRVVLYGQLPDLVYLGVAAAISVALCVVAYVFFKRMEMAMADII